MTSKAACPRKLAIFILAKSRIFMLETFGSSCLLGCTVKHITGHIVDSDSEVE